NQVGSMVVFEDALPKKKGYRTFSVPDGMDDLTAMRHVLDRRLGRLVKEKDVPVDEREASSFAYPPQLIVVDGGPTQVAVAAEVRDQWGLEDLWVVGLAKRLEELWLPGQDYPTIAPRGSEALFLLQRIRDEAHRFAITQHRRKRSKAMTAT